MHTNKEIRAKKFNAKRLDIVKKDKNITVIAKKAIINSHVTY